MADKKSKMSKSSKFLCAIISIAATAGVVYFLMNKCVKKTICSDNCDIEELLKDEEN